MMSQSDTAPSIGAQLNPLPDGWRIATLGEVCDPVDLISPSHEPSWRFNYVDISAIDRDSKEIVNPKRIFGVDAPSRAKQRIKADDVLVSTTRPNLNAVAQVPDELDGQVCSTGFCVLRPGPQVLSDWVFHYVRHREFVAELDQLSTGSSYPAVTDKQVKSRQLPVPPLPEQERIVRALQERIDSIDAAKRAAEAQLEAANAMSAAYLRQVFPAEGEELPEGWEWVRLGEVCAVSAGQSPPGTSYNEHGEGVEFHQGKVAFGDEFLMDSGKWTSQPRRLAEPGDILMSVRAPVGPVNIAQKRVAIGRGLASIQANPEFLLTQWIFQYLQSIQLRITGTEGTTFASINKAQIERIALPLSDLAEQRSIIDALHMRMRESNRMTRAAVAQVNSIDAMSDSYVRTAFEGCLV